MMPIATITGTPLLYESLHAKFLTWNAIHDRCCEKAVTGMINFFNGFRAYLNAPGDILHFCRVNPDVEGIHKYTRESIGKVLLQTDQNVWRFGIEIVFDAKGEIERKEVRLNIFSTYAWKLAFVL